jgi:hypothetical protein
MSRDELDILKEEIESLYKIEAQIRDLRQEMESRVRNILAKQVLAHARA